MHMYVLTLLRAHINNLYLHLGPRISECYFLCASSKCVFEWIYEFFCGIVYATKMFLTSGGFKSIPQQQNPVSKRSKRSLLTIQTAQYAMKKKIHLFIFHICSLGLLQQW